MGLRWCATCHQPRFCLTLHISSLAYKRRTVLRRCAARCSASCLQYRYLFFHHTLSSCFPTCSCFTSGSITFSCSRLFSCISRHFNSVMQALRDLSHISTILMYFIHPRYNCSQYLLLAILKAQHLNVFFCISL